MQQSHLPPRFPQSNSLITPSASPPPRHASIQQQYNRPAMSAPPLKRQRVSSTPRRMFHDPSPASSSSRSQPPIDIEKEREASRLRLLSAWDNLTRLVRPLDEDDIVNLRTGKITRDNGVLRSAHRINFGNMISPADNEGGDEDSDSGDEGGNETDELDTLTDRPLDLDETPPIDFEAAPKVLPPVTPLDPLDNKDLQEFLKAEQQRKDLCGSEPETEDEDEEDEDESQEENDDGTGQNSAQDEGVDADAGIQCEDLNQGTAEVLNGQDVFQVPFSPDDSSDAGVGLSDDELDDWGVDDASFVQPVTKFEEEEEVEAEVVAASDSDSDIEIIEGPYVQSSPIRPTASNFGQGLAPPKAKSESPQKKKTTIAQYLTPPLSSSSIHKSASSREPPSERQVDTHDTEFQHEPICPPPSSKTLSNIPRVDLTKLHKSKKLPTVRANSLASLSSPSSSSHSPSKTRVPKLKAIVLLTPRKPSTSQSHAEISQPLRVDVKGKQRARSSSPLDEQRTTTGNRQRSQKLEQPSSVIKHGSQKKSISNRPSDLKSTTGPTSTRGTPSRAGSSYKDDDQDHCDSATMSSPKKRKRRSSSVDTRHLGAPTHNEPKQRQSTSESEDIPAPSTHKRSSSRRRDREHSSGSDSEDVSSTSERGHLRRTPVSMSRPRTPSHTHQPPYSYAPRNSIPPFGPIPDPRAQFIITQAMQQLSALVTGSWIPPFESTTPPIYYPDLRYPNPYTTPTHRHPSRYDPDFSNATQPPDSPDPSPEKSENSRRKSLVRRSRSRGRRVSFHIDDNIASRDRSSSPAVDQDCNSSPTKPPRDRFRKRGTPFSGKGKARETHESSENSESDADKRTTYVRGQTPGPSWQLGERDHDKSRSHKSRS